MRYSNIRYTCVPVLLATLITLVAGAGAARASTTPIGSGDLPSAVTDQDGVTHVAWLEGHGDDAPDTVAYCRIHRGSTTCADIKHLTPTCTGGAPAATWHRVAGGILDGATPRVQITPFGDVFIITDGVCPWSFTSTQVDWQNMHWFMRQLVFHSTDDGNTFGPSTEGQAYPGGWRQAMDRSAGMTEDSTSVYDASDSRIVTVAEGGGGVYLDGGLFVLGRQDQIIPNGANPPDLTEPAKGLLAPYYVNNHPHASWPPALVQRFGQRGSFVVAWPGSYTRDGQFATMFLRTIDCPNPDGICPLNTISDASNWSNDITLPAEDGGNANNQGAENPKLVSGPLGTFLFYEDDQLQPTVPRWYVRKVDGNTLGPRHLVLTHPTIPNYTNAQADLVQNRSTGRLTAVLSTNPLDTSAPQTLYSTSDDGGTTWTPAIQLATYPANTGNVYAGGTDTLSIATGDDGFTGLLIHTGTPPDPSHSTNRAIYADALPGSATGDTGGTPIGAGDGGDTGGGPPGGGGTGGGGGAPGGGGTSPPPPNDVCRIKQFGPLDILADACLTIDKATGAITAKGGVSVNGLRMAGASITFDAKARTVKSSGPVTVSIGDTNLFKLPIDWKLPTGNTFTLPGVDIGSLGGKLKGFPVTGSADVQLVRGGVQIPLHVGLPKVFGGLSGDVTLRADNLSGIHIRDIHIKADLGSIGPLTLSNIEFTFNPDDDKWAGAATLALPPKPPGPVLAANIGFAGGDLEYLRNELTFPGEGIPLDSFNAVHLTKIRFSLETTPDLKLSGGVTFTAGPKFGELRVAEINGDLSFTFPDGRPAILRADGTLNLLNIPVAQAFLQYRTDGLITFGGSIGLDVFDIIQVHGSIDGWILPPKAFSVYGQARVCVGDLGCAGGEVGVSSKGFAGCVEIAGADVGVGYEWGPSILWAPSWLADLDIMFHGCSVGDYLVSASSAQATGARTVKVPDGLPFAVFRLTGATAPPHVALVSPSGQRIEVPADRPSQSRTLGIVHVPSKKLTLVVVHKPAGGSWRVEPAADSSALAAAGVAEGLPAPSVHAKVTGKGRKRVLSYTIKSIPGQKVRFEERAPGQKAAASLGYAKGTKGTLRFAPASGPKGRRSIVALVESYGTPRAQLNVARYTAPPPARPATPKRLKVVRKGTRLVVSWKRVAGASRYRVIVKLADGRSVLVLPGGKRTSATVRDVGRKLGATASVRAERADGTAGATATFRLRVRK
jgi:hypothetical protein